MIKKLITLLLVVTLCLPGVAQTSDVATVSTWNNRASSGFTENKGQVTNLSDGTPNTDVRFVMENGDTKCFLVNGGIAWQFNRVHYPAGYQELLNDPSFAKQEQARNMEKDIVLETWRMDMTLVGANKNATVIAEERSSDFVNYYNHNALDVHSYRKVTYQDIYEGIDWVIYLSGGQVKYDFIVHPGADASQIVIRYSDYETLQLNEDGSCSLGNKMGMITENAPVSFQNGKMIATQFVLEGNTLRFALGTYNSNETLVIDPIVRAWGTYYGGSSSETGYSCTIDPSGNVYMAGISASGAGIASGGHQNTHGGNYDAMLVKFTTAGTRIWATYYGGSAADYGDQCAADASGNIYMSGFTLSTSSIASGGHQNTAGGGYDVFLVKLNAAGTLQWCTYYGGSGAEMQSACTTDASGNVYLSAFTGSTSGIASGGHQNTYGGGTSDAFLVKFNSNGVRQWATYYGGSGRENGHGCATDASGNVYWVGEAESTSGIASGGHQNTQGGGIDAFLVKFNSAGVRQWATYYGGSGTDVGQCCRLDAAGNIYLSGSTGSSAAISSGGHQNTFGGSTFDGFLVKFNSAGVRQWGTYYGDSGYDIVNASAVDAEGNIYIAGTSNSTAAIGSGGYQNTIAGDYDAFAAKFNTAGVREWGTYYGGPAVDWGHGMHVSSSGLIYLCGYTQSASGIAANGFLNTSSSQDAFLVKLTPPPADALHFDGSDDIVNVPANPAFDFTTGTVECWFNTAGSSANSCLMAMRTNTSGARWSIHVNENSNELGIFNGAAFTALPVTINPNTWYHLAVVMNTTSAIFYLNGVNVGTIALGIQTSATGLPLTIGGHTDPAWPEYFQGAIDEVRIWNRALCASEIISCMSGETPAFSNGLVADYHFNHGYDGANNAGIITLTDASGNNRNGTLQNFMLNGTLSNWIAPGGTTSGSTATPVITASTSSTNVSCNGGNNGSATVTATGTGPFTYSWAPNGGSAATATGLAPGTYTCTVSNGCVSTTATVAITQPAPISFSAVVTHISCSSSNDGAIDLTVNGGTGPFSYDWSFGYTTEDISNLYPGTYMVTVTDANGCNASSSQFSVSYSSTLTSSVSVAPFPCTGGTTTATMTPSGGTAPYTYSWSPSGGSGATSTPIGPGTYFCTVTDANGCSSSQSFTITQPAALTASAAVTSNYNGFPTSCFGSYDGQVTSTVSGGTGPYTYQWSNGMITPVINGVTMGVYTYTVTDVNGCSTTASVMLTSPAALSASVTTTHVSCNGNSNGAINLTMSGGAGGYSYNWSNSATTEDINGLAPATYSVSITDVNGCNTTASATVTQPPVLTSSATATSITCNGGTATVTVTGSGGTAPYSGTGTFTVSAGTYSYTVTDARGCTSTTSLTVTQPPLLTAAASATSITCNGGTATVTVSGSGGTAPYSGTGTFTVSAGTYSYTVTDANGCTSTTSITVTQPALLTAASSSTAILCNGGTATVTVTGAGGTSPYTGTGTFTVTAGTYSYPVTDANGCTSTTSITVTQPALLTAASSSTAILCNGGSATVTVTGAGGTSPYTGTGTFTAAAGTYSYPVTDANGCASTTSITVTEPTLLTAASSSTAILCNGGTATVTVTGAGGTSPYSGEGTFIETAGTYSYAVTDANGCTSTTSITVTEPTLLTAAASSTAILCNGGTATVTVTGAGGTSPYTGEGTFTEVAGTYSYAVTDVNGCTSTTTITVVEPAVLSASVSNAVNPATCGGTDGSIDISVTGGTTAYSFLWSNSDVTEDLTAIGAGSYSVTVTDANGCTATATASVNDPGAPAVTLSLPTDTVCGDFPGTITLSGESPAGGIFSGTAVSGNTFDPFTAGTGLHYITYTYTDINGCTGSTTDSILVDGCMGVQTVATTEWSLFPNPTNAELTINTSAEINTTVQIEIYSADGKLIASENKPQTNTITLNMTNEPVGVYFIRITANGNASMHRVVKM